MTSRVIFAELCRYMKQITSIPYDYVILSSCNRKCGTNLAVIWLRNVQMIEIERWHTICSLYCSIMLRFEQLLIRLNLLHPIESIFRLKGSTILMG